MKKTVNSWIIKDDSYDRNEKRNERNRQNRYQPNFNVYLCPVCNQVYEEYYSPAKGIERTYHDDFPTYKLERAICIECNE